MPLLPLTLRPGIHADVSPYSAGSAGAYYIDGQNVRFVKGFLTRRGASTPAPVNCTGHGEVRDVHFWQDNKGENFIAIGTTEKLLLVRTDTCHDITPAGLSLSGRTSYSSGLGWSTGGWSEGTWSTPRPVATAEFEPIQWSFANFGEDLVIVLRNGDVFYWDRSAFTGNTAPRAVRLDSLTPSDTKTTGRIPNNARSVIVTSPDRHVMVGGTDPINKLDSVINPMLVRWSHQESLTDWNPDENDTGGDILLTEGNEIMSMLSTQQENLIWTDYALYTMRYTETFAFVPTLVGTNCGSISKNAVADVNGRAYWMSDDDFYVYAGGLPEPIPCSIKYKVFDNIHQAHKKLIFVGVNPEYNEISWFYRDLNNIPRYATFNYEENWWTMGVNNIAVWSDTNGMFDKPVSFTHAGQMQYEEQDGGSLPSFAETAPFEMASGSGQSIEQGEYFTEGHELLYLKRFVPDFNRLSGRMRVTLSGRKYPEGDMKAKPTFTIERGTRKKDIKLRMRQMRLKFETSDAFQMGTHRVEITPDGMR